MSKTSVRVGYFTFQITEMVNVWSYFCSCKIGPPKISSLVLHDGYFCRILGPRVKKPLLWTFLALAPL